VSRILFVRFRDGTFSQFTVDDSFQMKEFSTDCEGIAWEFEEGGGLYLRMEDVRSAYLCDAANVTLAELQPDAA